MALQTAFANWEFKSPFTSHWSLSDACLGEPNPVEMNVSPLPGETGPTLLCRVREIVEVPFGVALDRLQIWICIGSFLTGYK